MQMFAKVTSLKISRSLMIDLQRIVEWELCDQRMCCVVYLPFIFLHCIVCILSVGLWFIQLLSI